MEKLLVFSFLFFSVFSAKDSLPPQPHALYLGVIHLSHHETESTTSINVRVFADDLQNVLKNAFQLDALPAVEEICASESSKVEQYFQEHLRLHMNKQPITLLLEDCEQINEVYTLRFQALTPPAWNTIDIQADFFMELFPTQSNVFQGNYYTGIVGKDEQLYGRMMKGKERLSFEIAY